MKKFHVHAWLPNGECETPDIAADNYFADDVRVVFYERREAGGIEYTRTVAVYNVQVLASIRIEESNE